MVLVSYSRLFAVILRAVGTPHIYSSRVFYFPVHLSKYSTHPFRWADVPITKHDEVYLLPCAQGPPTVKYRGIFLNDEEPALSNWAKAKFTNGTLSELMHSPFNHHFYEKL